MIVFRNMYMTADAEEIVRPVLVSRCKDRRHVVGADEAGFHPAVAVLEVAYKGGHIVVAAGLALLQGNVMRNALAVFNLLWREVCQRICRRCLLAFGKVGGWERSLCGCTDSILFCAILVCVFFAQAGFPALGHCRICLGNIVVPGLFLERIILVFLGRKICGCRFCVWPGFNHGFGHGYHCFRVCFWLDFRVFCREV